MYMLEQSPLSSLHSANTILPPLNLTKLKRERTFIYIVRQTVKGLMCGNQLQDLLTEREYGFFSLVLFWFVLVYLITVFNSFCTSTTDDQSHFV